MIIAGVELPEELMIRPFWKRLWLFDFYQSEKMSYVHRKFDPLSELSPLAQTIKLLKEWDKINGFDNDDEWSNLYYYRSILKKLNGTSSTIEEMIEEIEAIIQK